MMDWVNVALGVAVVTWVAGRAAEGAEVPPEMAQGIEILTAEPWGADRPAPDWLQQMDRYNGGYYADWTEDAMDTLLRRYPLVVGVPHLKLSVLAAHRRGFKVLPYVSYVKSLNAAAAEQGKLAHELWDAELWGVSPFWWTCDTTRHPEWIDWDEQGKPYAVFGQPDYGGAVGASHHLCLNSPGAIEALLTGVKRLMDLGCDGLFVDNGYAAPECYGDKLGQHPHRWPDKSQEECYRILLNSAYKLIKGYGNDKVQMINGDWEYRHYGDALMFESWLYTYVAGTPDQRLPGHWSKIESMARRVQPYRDSGRVPVQFDYPAAGPPQFDSVACSHLAGLIPHVGPAPEEWVDARPGPPVGPLQVEGEVMYRLLERGVAVGNKGKQDVTAAIPAPVDRGEVREVETGARFAFAGGVLKVPVKADWASVFVLTEPEQWGTLPLVTKRIPDQDIPIAREVAYHTGFEAEEGFSAGPLGGDAITPVGGHWNNEWHGGASISPEQAHSGQQSLKSVATGMGVDFLYAYFAPETEGVWRVGFWVWPSADRWAVQVGALRGRRARAVRLQCEKEGQVRWGRGQEMEDGVPTDQLCEPGKWHHVTLRLDLNQRIFDAALDGRAVVEGAAFMDGKSVDYVEVRTHGTLYLDDFEWAREGGS
jgi:hypothetical protein